MTSIEELDQKLRAAGKQPTAEETSSQLGEAENGGGLAFRLAIELVATLAVGMGLGWVSDTQLGTGPWGILVGALFGMIAGFYNFYRLAKRAGLTDDTPTPMPNTTTENESDRKP